MSWLFARTPIVKVGDKVKKGQLLTDGSADIAEMFKFGSKELVEEYIIREINKVYELQSASISRKHTEIIIRQMFSRRKIKDAGETNFSIGDIVENTAFIEENIRVAETNGKEGKSGNSGAWHYRSFASHQELALGRIIPKYQSRAY